jgi:hypothetical protein
LKPPEVKEKWEDNDWWTQLCLIEYDVGRTQEEVGEMPNDQK